MLQRLHHRLGKVLYVDEREHLLLEPYAKVEPILYCTHHHQIVALVRTIDARAAEYGVGKIGYCAQARLAIEFAQTVCRVGRRYALRREWLVANLVAYAHHT